MVDNSFHYRGVIEGFYGKPWTEEERLNTITWMGKFKMNLFILAPKDDPWHRFKWRDPFHENFLFSAKRLYEHGVTNSVDVSIAISPGLSVKYSSVEDRVAMLNKLKQLHLLGFRHFSLFWDDINWDLTEPEDVEKYKFIEDGQSDFTNWIYSEIEKFCEDFTFTLCPMIYWGRGHSPYLAQLAKNLNPKINIMWTGRQIRSEYLDSSDAEVFIKDTKRKPFYWDNYPVNNLNLRYQLHMGPLVGRDNSLSNFSIGLLANPMLQARASLVPIATIADYLFDPINYDPEKSWIEALNRIYLNKEDREALQTFYSCLRSSQLSNDAAPELRKALSKSTICRRSNELPESIAILKEILERFNDSYSKLTSPNFSEPKLFQEIAPWVDKYKDGISCLKEIINLYVNKFENYSEIIPELRFLMDNNRYEMFGDLFDEYLAELHAELDSQFL